MSKELIAMIVSFVVAWLAPHLGALGLPSEVASEWVAVAGALVFAVAATIRWMISKAPTIAGPAAIAVALIEESMRDSPNEQKRTSAVESLRRMIDAMQIGTIQKWLLKQAAPQAIELIVKQAKVLLYRHSPDEPPTAIPAT